MDLHENVAQGSIPQNTGWVDIKGYCQNCLRIKVKIRAFKFSIYGQLIVHKCYRSLWNCTTRFHTSKGGYGLILS